MVDKEENQSNFEVMISEKRVEIGKQFINFLVSKLKYSKVEKTLILLPSTLGTGFIDFKPHLENLPKLLQNYQIIAWDPPGLGKSFPPERNVAIEELENNADILHDFVNFLKLRKFSLLGYSAGGITSIFYASKYPENVDKLILTSANPFISESQLKYFENIRDISTWPNETRESLIQQYGVEYLTKMWEKHCDNLKGISKKYSQNYMKPIFNKIKAETMVVYGDEDPFITKDCMDFMSENVKNSKVVIYSGGRHNLHNHFVNDFNQKIGEFLLCKNKI